MLKCGHIHNLNLNRHIQQYYCDKSITGHARNTFEAWGLIVYCLTTRAVAIWVCSGCDTKAPLIALNATLNFQELQAALNSVVAILNLRPLVADWLARDVEAITTAMLLWGRTAGNTVTSPEVFTLLHFETPQSRTTSRLAVVQ